jgi:WXG100 family type VII secretion target
MRKITVEPELLEAAAARIEESNADYVRNYTDLFSTVDTLSSAWQGKDNTAFTNRISKFEADFRQISMLCDQYAEFLKNSARAYRETQDELTSQAGMLEQ